MTAISIARQFVLRRVFEALHIRRPLSAAELAVVAERRRQVDVEGLVDAHDDAHEIGDLASAGAAYAIGATGPDEYPVHRPASFWPWSREWWKPRDFRRDLVRAAALIVAEIDKFDRAKTNRRRPILIALTEITTNLAASGALAVYVAAVQVLTGLCLAACVAVVAFGITTGAIR